MKPTSLLRAALLLLVVASLGVWVLRSLRATRPADAAPAVSPIAADGVAVINFHGKLRCPTCLGIGSLSQAVVDEQFGDLVREGRVSWQSIDFDAPENEHFKEDYDLVSSNVVVVRREGGRDADWRRLDDVWTYYGDEPRFREYVGDAVHDLLAGRKP